MTAQDPRELVRELDALGESLGVLARAATFGGRKEDKAYLEALRQGWADFIVIWHNALRAAALRVAELEELLRDVRAHLHQPGFDDCDGKDSCPWSAEHAIVARMDAALSASPAQGEEEP